MYEALGSNNIGSQAWVGKAVGGGSGAHAPVPSFKERLVRSSFYFTYVMLFTTGTITFIEALRTQSPYIRHVMNLETCISIVAAFFYSLFIEKLKTVEFGAPLPFDDLTTIRYNDWMISTPLMLLVLCIVLGTENKRQLHFWVFALVLVLDLGMLISGYLGEMNKINKKAALVIGFAFFIAMFGFIWYYFMQGAKNGFAVTLVFTIFVSVWSVYGLIYSMDDDTRNTVYNVLDVIAKCFVGILFWLYFTRVVEF